MAIQIASFFILLLLVFLHLEFTLPCGERGYNDKGDDASPENWPWYAALYNSDDKYIASGSIISEWFVLTVAQATFTVGNIPLKPNEIHIAFSSAGFLSSQEHTKKANVSNIIRYENNDQTTLLNDLALLKVLSVIEFNNHISPICLWPNFGPSLEELAAQDQSGILLSWTGERKLRLSETNVSAQNIVRCDVIAPANLAKNKNFCLYRRNYVVKNGDGLFFKIQDVWHMRAVISLRSSTDDALVVHLIDLTFYQKWIEKNALPKRHNLLGLEECGLGRYLEHKENEQEILTADRHPWIAQLVYSFWDRFNVSDCHGVLIHPEFVITSAKCTDNQKYRKLSYVILGESSIGKDPYDEGKNNIQVVKISEHLFSQAAKNLQRIFDINVLRLAKNVILTESVKPVCLASVEESVPYFTMTAWHRGTEHPKELKTTLMRLTPFDQCQSTYSEIGINITSEDFVTCFEPCELSVEAQSDETYRCESIKTRRCDKVLSASPIFYTKHDGISTHTYLAGVRSFGSAYCHDSIHDVFNDIVSFGPWIQTLVDEKAWFTDDDDHLLHDYESVTHTIHYELDDDGNLINEDGDHLDEIND